MLLCLGLSILFGHAEIDHVNNIGGLWSGPSDEEIVGLDIPVDQILLVNSLNSWQLNRELIKQPQNMLQVEIPFAWPPSQQFW